MERKSTRESGAEKWGKLLTLASILDGSVTNKSKDVSDYVEVHVISASIPDFKNQNFNVERYFLFGDKDSYITGLVVLKEKDNIYDRNIITKLKMNKVCRIKNFSIELKGIYDTMIRSQTQLLKLTRNTTDVCTDDLPSPFPNFMQHIPFEFTTLEGIDKVANDELVDIISIMTEVVKPYDSPFKSQNEFQSQKSQTPSKNKKEESTKNTSKKLELCSSLQDDQRFFRTLMLFGGYADFKIKKKAVYAVLNAKVKTCNDKKLLNSTKTTVIVEIPRNKIENILPSYFNETIVQSLFPKSRQSLRRKLDLQQNEISPTVMTEIPPDEIEEIPPNHFNEPIVQSLPKSRQSLKRKLDFQQNEITHDSILADIDRRIEQNSVHDPKPGPSRDVKIQDVEICDQETPEISVSNNNGQKQDKLCEEAGTYNFSMFKPLKVDVRKAEAYKDTDDPSPCYQMRSKPRGFALILENRNFPLRENSTRIREGSEHDTENLKSFFRQCDIKVMNRTDVKSTDVPNIISKFKKMFTKTVDSCFVVVLSHGKDRQVEMVDGVFINVYDEIIYKFSEQPDVFPAMKGKPKVFILQTCLEEGQENCSTNSTQTPPTEIIPKGISNMIVCHPNIPGHKAWRDTKLGSHFIYTMVNTMMKHAYNTHFLAILHDVRDELEKVKVRRERRNFYQSPWQADFGFSKLLFFNPGI